MEISNFKIKYIFIDKKKYISKIELYNKVKFGNKCRSRMNGKVDAKDISEAQYGVNDGNCSIRAECSSKVNDICTIEYIEPFKDYNSLTCF